MPFPSDLSGWSVEEKGGLAPGVGSVTAASGDAVMREGNSFLVTLKHTFIVPEEATELAFSYSDLSFDTTDSASINDAFEAALVDSTGHSLVYAIAGNRDAFFNVTEGLPAALGSGVKADGQEVTVDVSGILPGTSAALIFRLVNNDTDTGTSVRLTGVGLPGEDMPPQVAVALKNDTAPSGPDALVAPFRIDGLTNDPTVTGTAADDVQVVKLEAQVDSGSFVDITASLNSGHFEYTPGGLLPGPHSITVRATDDAGLTAESTVAFRLNTLPAADAGGDQTVGEGGTLAFDGSRSSDAESPIFAYQWTFDDGTTAAGPTASRAYLQDGIYPVSLAVTDTAGSIVTDSIDVTVQNLAAVIDSIADRQSDEGESLRLTAHFADPGVLDTHTARVDWGDGTIEAAAVQEQTGAGTASGTHSYLRAGIYQGRVTVTDDGGAVAWQPFTVTVTNVAPTVEAGPNATIAEGGTFVGSGWFSDPGTETWTATVDYGDGSGVKPLALNADKTFALSHVYGHEGSYGVTVVVRDDGNLTGSDTLTVAATNVTPTVEAGPTATIAEGGTFVGTGWFSDPGADTWTATVDYGDGSGVKPLTLNANKTFGLSHVYGHEGSYGVTVVVRDDGNLSASDTLTVTATNVAPTVEAGPNATIAEGGTFVASGSFSDPGADTWTATVDYGDGSGVKPLTLNANKTFALSHVYGHEGSYGVTVVVRDDGNLTGSDTLTVTVIANFSIYSSIYVLDSAASGALSLSGNGNITIPGRIVVDSNSDRKSVV
jgi:hypothetical protein